MSVLTSSVSAIQKPQLYSKLLLALLVLLGVVAPLFVPSGLFVLALVGIPTFLLVLYALWCAFSGAAEPILLVWVSLFPLGYYFLSYPAEHSIVTLDRAVAALLTVAMGFTPVRKITLAPLPLRQTALAWGTYLVAAAVSMIDSTVTLYKVRLFVETLILPAFLAWYVIRSFEVRRHIRLLHLLTCLMIIYTAGIGIAELALGTDLLKLPGGGVYVVGLGGHYLVRPNGPFLANHSFSLIGLITFVFLIFLRRVLGDGLPNAQRLLHAVAVPCALACALMPLYRSIILTLVVIAGLELRRPHLSRSRLPAFSVVGVVLLYFVGLKFVAPAAYEERLSAVNIFGRIAQNEQTEAVFLAHPLTGVGFGSFGDAAETLPADLGSFRGIGPSDSPHNSLGSALAETGLLGFLPFISAQVLLVIAFRRLKKEARPGSELVWAFFVYAFLAYWITGMSLTSFQSSDLNLWFMFTVACLYKYALTGPPLSQSLTSPEARPV